MHVWKEWAELRNRSAEGNALYNEDLYGFVEARILNLVQQSFIWVRI